MAAVRNLQRATKPLKYKESHNFAMFAPVLTTVYLLNMLLPPPQAFHSAKSNWETGREQKGASAPPH